MMRWTARRCLCTFVSAAVILSILCVVHCEVGHSYPGAATRSGLHDAEMDPTQDRDRARRTAAHDGNFGHTDRTHDKVSGMAVRGVTDAVDSNVPTKTLTANSGNWLSLSPNLRAHALLTPHYLHRLRCSLSSLSLSASQLSLADGLDYDLGKGLGLTREHEVPTSVVQSVIHAADQGNRGVDG